MPRSAFFSKETIAKAGIEIVRHEGFEALTARALSKQLNCSLSPIFTVFEDMEQIRNAVRDEAYRLFSDYVRDVIDYTPAFKEYGMRLIRFAKYEQNLFHMLFLQKLTRYGGIPETAVECLKGIKEDYELDDDQVAVLFRQMWTFTCGITVLATQAPDDYPEDVTSEMISTQFISTLSLLKSGHKVKNITPHSRTDEETGAKILP